MTKLGNKDTEGPLADLNEKLAGSNGEAWLMNLKRFLRKEIPWIHNDPRNGLIEALPPVLYEGVVYGFALVRGDIIPNGCGRAGDQLVEAVRQKSCLPIPIDRDIQLLLSNRLINNWQELGFEKVTVLFESGSAQTYDKGIQWTHLPPAMFRWQPPSQRPEISCGQGPDRAKQWDEKDEFIVLVPLQMVAE
jgi:hypothetical protein